MSGRVEALAKLDSSLLSERDVRFPCSAGDLAFQEEGLLRAPARPAPRAAVRLSLLPPELQFTDLRHHLLAQAPAPARRPLPSPRRLLGPAPDRPRVRPRPQQRAAPERAPGTPLPAAARGAPAEGRTDRAARARRPADLRAQPVLALRPEPPGRGLALRLRLQRRRASPQRHPATGPAVEARRARGRPRAAAPQATRQAVAELVGRIVPPGAAVVLASDEHAAYPQAFARLADREDPTTARPRRGRAGRLATRSSRPTWRTSCCVTRAPTTSARPSPSRSGARGRSTARRSGRCGATS